ncbi:hypothetical protein [Streptomyces sp. NPDC047070]|uniref:hypothetical protein n=1 Tax=Streptomyces sp. NPDC047070 TaxID=3154923 RepID=UPI003451EBBE
MYGRSKILAEQAAWEFIRAEGGRTELATICPVAGMGPVLGNVSADPITSSSAA